MHHSNYPLYRSRIFLKCFAALAATVAGTKTPRPLDKIANHGRRFCEQIRLGFFAPTDVAAIVHPSQKETLRVREPRKLRGSRMELGGKD
jgi:hypothetical protein